MSLRTKLAPVLAHFPQYVERYTVLGIGVLTSISGLLGTLAADLGGADTAAGRAVLGATAALSTATAGLIWLRGRREWKLLETWGPTLAKLVGGSGVSAQDLSVPKIEMPKTEGQPKAPTTPAKSVGELHPPTIAHEAPTQVVPSVPPTPAAPSGSQGSKQDPTVPTIDLPKP